MDQQKAKHPSASKRDANRLSVSGMLNEINLMKFGNISALSDLSNINEEHEFEESKVKPKAKPEKVATFAMQNEVSFGEQPTKVEDRQQKLSKEKPQVKVEESVKIMTEPKQKEKKQKRPRPVRSPIADPYRDELDVIPPRKESNQRPAPTETTD